MPRPRPAENEIVIVPRWTCVRCGHHWIGRIPSRPVRCPMCRQAKWDKPRTRPQRSLASGAGE
jgi:rubrerythrin